MPLTQMLTTAIDRAPAREAMAAAVLAYVDSDLICYPADAPEPLRIEQEALLAPWLKWFEARFGVELLTTYLLARLDQPCILLLLQQGPLLSLWRLLRAISKPSRLGAALYARSFYTSVCTILKNTGLTRLKKNAAIILSATLRLPSSF